MCIKYLLSASKNIEYACHKYLKLRGRGVLLKTEAVGFAPNLRRSGVVNIVNSRVRDGRQLRLWEWEMGVALKLPTHGLMRKDAGKR